MTESTHLNNSMPQYRYHIVNSRGEQVESNLPDRSHAEAVINHLKDTDPCNPYTIVEEQIFSKESTRLGRDPDLHQTMTKTKRKHKHKSKHKEETTTYDPSIHDKRGSGYHMKKDAPLEDCSGESIRHILFPKTSVQAPLLACVIEQDDDDCVII